MKIDLRILMVDDQPDSMQPVLDEVRESFSNVEGKIVGFAEMDATIDSFEPQIIILDLFRGIPSANDAPGLAILDDIWNQKFCPLVIYTAAPDTLASDERVNHPFVKLVQKGSGSEEIIVADIRTFEPYITALSATSKEIRVTLNRALRDVHLQIIQGLGNTQESREILVRAARRRVAAEMDNELSTGGPSLKAWEHYLCPPIVADHALTGDIIRKHDGDLNHPSSYAVVLTPSCDLVPRGTRGPKVRRALIAKCAEVGRTLREFAIVDRAGGRRCKDKIRALLTEGYGKSCLPIAGLPGIFPPMTADFQCLELVNVEDIGFNGKPWIRVASVDNPFRELVAWAYMASAGRPGLPERDFDAWVEEFILALPEGTGDA